MISASVVQRARDEIAALYPREVRIGNWTGKIAYVLVRRLVRSLWTVAGKRLGTWNSGYEVGSMVKHVFSAQREGKRKG